MPPTLEHVLTMRIFRKKEDHIGFNSTRGDAHRHVSPLSGGYLQGDNVNAQLAPGCSDWLRVDIATGTGYLDARLQFRDDASGAAFYIRFEGVIRLDPKIQRIIEWSPEAATTESKDHYSFINPVIEVSKEEHKWMEQTAFVGHGHYVIPGDGTQAVEYEIYKLISG